MAATARGRPYDWPRGPSRAGLGTFAHGQSRVDCEYRPDPHELREKRAAKARGHVEQAGLDALLCWKDENVRYLTGLRAQHRRQERTAERVPARARRAPPILLCSGGEAQRARNVMPWIEELRVVPIMEARGLVRGTVEHTLAPLLAEHGIEKLGIDELALCQLDALQELVPGVGARDEDQGA